ncbi:MAG TPA: MerR family transcriptional regulator [Ktedonobacterales bacterium]|jgi:MerR family transcriptional regulator/heat shock protein HspR|nr:MerR family transcriptional regulator [Ktedonobacterales bacterium]
MRRTHTDAQGVEAERPRLPDADFPKYSIAVASDISGVPQQQLRRMEESGLVSPSRTEGKTRRYSDNDLTHIAEIANLSDEGINASGIRYILQLRRDIDALRAEVAELRERLERTEGEHSKRQRR